MRVYVDGHFARESIRPFDEPAYTPQGAAPASPNFIGRVSSGFVFRGRIDEVALYDRVLSDSEILEHYFVAIGETLHDCNENGTLDQIDLASGESPDCNSNLIPDECESMFVLLASSGCSNVIRPIETSIRVPLSIE